MVCRVWYHSIEMILSYLCFSDGITCWTCSSGATPNCGADFNSTGLTSMQCSGNVSCSIITQNNGKYTVYVNIMPSTFQLTVK